MGILIVGGDRVEKLVSALDERGLGPSVHWNGRRSGELHRSFPPGVDLVVVVWEQLGHPMLRKVKEAAQRRGVPVLYGRTAQTGAGSVPEVVELAARWLAQSAA
jgi:hypothetical protein